MDNYFAVAGLITITYIISTTLAIIAAIALSTLLDKIGTLK